MAGLAAGICISDREREGGKVGGGGDGLRFEVMALRAGGNGHSAPSDSNGGHPPKQRAMIRMVQEGRMRQNGSTASAGALRDKYVAVVPILHDEGQLKLSLCAICVPPLALDAYRDGM